MFGERHVDEVVSRSFVDYCELFYTHLINSYSLRNENYGNVSDWHHRISEGSHVQATHAPCGTRSGSCTRNVPGQAVMML
jgi:hypothetical protein